MDSINLQEQLLIDKYLSNQLTGQTKKEFKAALKIPEFAEAVALQRALQDYLLEEAGQSPLKGIFEGIAAERRGE